MSVSIGQVTSSVEVVDHVGADGGDDPRLDRLQYRLASLDRLDARLRDHDDDD